MVAALDTMQESLKDIRFSMLLALAMRMFFSYTLQIQNDMIYN